MATRVTTPTSGSAISASRASSPRCDIPISTTADSCASSSRSSVSGTPYSLFRLPSDFRTRNRAASSAANISLVVVLPTEPATPARRRPQRRRTACASRCSAARVSSAGRSFPRIPSGYSANRRGSTTAASAPRARADSTKACPSCRSPCMATYSSPAPIVRESIETPASRVRGSSATGGATLRTRATSSTVHRITSLTGSP